MTLSQRWSECIELAAFTQRTPLSLVIFFFYSCLYCFEKYLLFIILKLTFATLQILSFWNWKPTCMGPMSACSGMSTWHLHALYKLYAFACPVSKNDKKCVCVHLCVLLLSSNKDQQSGKLMQAVGMQPGDLIQDTTVGIQSTVWYCILNKMIKWILSEFCSIAGYHRISVSRASTTRCSCSSLIASSAASILEIWEATRQPAKNTMLEIVDMRNH